MGDFFTEQGAPIAEKDLAAHIQAGSAMADPSQEYEVRDGAGVLQKVRGDQVANALGAGWSILPKAEAAFESRRAENESTISNIQTAAERAAGTFSLGLTDKLARTFAPEYEDRAAERADVNRSAGAIGEAVGMVAPSPLGKGVSSLVSKVTRGAEASTALGRMALRAAEGTAQGGLEGAIYGAGGEVSQSALKGDELTAEKVLSGAGRGGLFGALMGGAIGAGAGAVESRLAGRAEHVGAEMDALAAKKTEALAEKLRKDGVSEDRIAERVANEAERLGKRQSAIQRFANEQAMNSLEPSAALLKERAERAGGTVDELIQRAGQDYLGYEMKTGPLAGKRIFHGAKNPIDVIDDVGQALRETRKQVGHFEEMAERGAIAKPEVLPDAAPVQATLNSILAPNSKRAPSQFARDVASDVAPVLVAEGKLSLTDLRAASDAIAARIEGTTSKPQIRQLSEVKRALDESAAKGTRDSLAAAGIDSAQFLEAQRVHSSLSLVHDALEEMKLETKSGKHGGGLTGYAMAAVLGGHFPHSALAGASLLAHKLIHERAGGIAAEVAHRVANSDVRLGWGAKAVAGDAWGGARRVATGQLDAAPVIRRVQEIAGTPGGAEKFVGEQLAPVSVQYPDLGQAASMKLIGDIQYLAAHAPAPIGRGAASLTPSAVDSKFPPKAAAEWLERAKALQDPGFVVDEVLNGRVPEAAIAALKERRPMLWEQLRADVAKEVALRSDELPFKRRITIGMAFDFSSDKSLMPGTIRSIQESAFASPQESAPNGLPTGAPGRPAAPKVDIAPMQSMTERIGTGA